MILTYWMKHVLWQVLLFSSFPHYNILVCNKTAALICLRQKWKKAITHHCFGVHVVLILQPKLSCVTNGGKNTEKKDQWHSFMLIFFSDLSIFSYRTCLPKAGVWRPKSPWSARKCRKRPCLRSTENCRFRLSPKRTRMTFWICLKDSFSK